MPKTKTIKMKPYMSKCCGEGVKIVGGTPDFIGDKKASTYNFVCEVCKKPCDIEPFDMKKAGQKLKRILK